MTMCPVPTEWHTGKPRPGTPSGTLEKPENRDPGPILVH